MSDMEEVLRSNPPLVSVLTTVYNREQYVATAIEGVLAQSMPDFELIIVDDGSTDQSVEIARQYEYDRRIRIYVNETNLGDYPNRKRAASLARGKYLKYVDSDDAIYPHCLETMVHMMENHPQAGMLLCAWSEHDPFYPFELSPREVYQRCFIHEERMGNSPLTTMYRKNAFEDIGGFRGEKWSFCSDWDMILRIARNYPVLFAPTGFCFYRVHEGQVITTTNVTHNYTTEGLAISLEALRHPDCPLPDDEKKWVAGKLIRGAVKCVASIALKWRKPFAAKRFLRTCVTGREEWKKLFQFQKPLVSRPNMTAIPDCSAYPRTKPLGSVKKQPQNIKVSVVIPALSGQNNLKSTIESVLVQSLSQFELIICTADESLFQEISTEPCWSDPRIRILNMNTENSDQEMMNQAAKAARAEYVKFFRTGMIMYPWALEHIIFPLCKKKAQLAVECAAGYLIYPAAIDFQNACRENFLRGGIFVMPPEAGCVKRDTFLELGGFNVELDKAASHDMWIRLGLKGDIVLPVTGLTTAYKGWQYPVPQAFMAGILPEQYKKTLCNWLESVSNKLDPSLFKEIMARLNMSEKELAKAERPDRMPLSADWSLYPWSKQNPSDKEALTI
ncbi:MAG: glycosyltransferase family 2 protein [bacterium]|nr:glycosyltransferase family 2 protein [bacterium]